MTHKPKILVVEDDPAILRQLETTLKTMGAEPVCFTSSRKAAQLIGKQKFDGAFLDWDTPELKGGELTQMIRRSKSNAKMPIAMITEHTDTRAISQGFKLGVTFFLSKPVGPKELGRLLNASRGAMLEERRRYQRAMVKVPVECAWEEKRIKGQSEDLSASGVMVALPQAPEVGKEVTVEFTLPGAGTFSFKATVVRTAPGPKVGVHFGKVPREERDALKNFVERHMSRRLGR